MIFYTFLPESTSNFFSLRSLSLIHIKYESMQILGTLLALLKWTQAQNRDEEIYPNSTTAYLAARYYENSLFDGWKL